MRLVLVGAGGNAKSLVNQFDIAAYVDPHPACWLPLPRVTEAEIADYDGFLLGVGGVTPEQLRKRLALFDRLRRQFETPPCIVKAGAQVEPGAIIGDGALLNTGAIVCHDAVVGVGSHIAPGAIILGGATIGACCMIGAGAVVLPGAVVPDDTLVKALTRWKGNGP